MTTTASQPATHAPRSTGWEFFWLLVRRDLRFRYAGSTLGGLWNLIHPIVMIVIYVVIFSSLIPGRLGAEAGPRVYIVHLCTGMLVWLVFAEVLNRSAATLIDNSNFLQKVSFPPLVLHASILFNVVLIYGAGLVVVWLLLLITGEPPPVSSFGALGVMALAGAAACGMGMILSALNVFFRDTAQIVSILLQVGFWLNPIVYPKSLIESSPLGDWSGLLALNPTVHFVSLAQSLFGDPTAAPWRFSPVVVLVFPIICLVAGIAIFRRLLPDVRDGL